MIGSITSYMLGGLLSAKFGRKKILLVGTFIGAIAGAACPFASQKIILFVLRFMVGFGHGLAYTNLGKCATNPVLV